MKSIKKPAIPSVGQTGARFTRRSLLKLAPGIGLVVAGVSSSALLPALASADSHSGISQASQERALAILAANPSIDLHNHLGYWETKNITPAMPPLAYAGDDSTRGIVQAMVDGGCKSAWVCFTGDNPLLKLGVPGNKAGDYSDDEAWQEYQRQKALFDDFLGGMPMEIARNPADVDRIAAEGKLAVFLSTEGSHMVQEDLDRIDVLAESGVTKFQPVHYVHNKLGDNQTDPSAFGGMSILGKQAIRRANQAGMVIDVAHASYDAAKHMIDLTPNPVVLSHTMLKFGPYLSNRPRFITRDYAFLVAQTGGVVGTWTVGDPVGVKTLQEFIQGVTTLVDTIGIDHVGWSTDYITFSMPPWFNDFHQFPMLCAGLLDAGFSDQDLVKFIGGNALRVMAQVQGTG